MARTGERDLGVVALVHGDDVAAAERLLEEGHDGPAALMGELARLVRRGGVVGQQFSELGEALGVEEAEIAVLQLTDGFDLVEIHVPECTDGRHEESSDRPAAGVLRCRGEVARALANG
jgi:hypothetical protein